MKHRRLTYGAVALAVLLAYPPEPTHAAQGDFSRDDRKTLVAKAADAIENRYLDAKKGAAIAGALRRDASLHQADIAAPLFAVHINEALFSASGDAHLKLRWMPKSVEGSLSIPPDFGVRAVRILDGNIGLLRLDGFYDTVEARRHLLTSLSLLQYTDALILDFRENQGGASEVVRLLQGCFFTTPEKVMIYEDSPDDRIDSYSEKWTSDAFCDGKPLAVLVGPRTASAAEDFALSVQVFELGTLIGERTAGAAHFVEHVWLDKGFRLAVSVGRPVHPLTGDNWEGSGLSPDVTATENADLVAHVNLLEALSRGAQRGDLQYLSLRLSTGLAETTSREPLKSYAGRYGPLRVDLLADGLQLRGLGYKSGLLSAGSGAFLMEEDDLPAVLFSEPDERGKRQLTLLYPNGEKQTFGAR